MLDYPLGLYRGDSYHWQFVVWADKAGTIPADLTGVIVAAEIRDKPDGTVIVTLPCVLAANVIDIVLSAAECQKIPTAAAWDLQLTFPSGDVKTIVAGRVAGRLDITKAAAA